MNAFADLVNALDTENKNPPLSSTLFSNKMLDQAPWFDRKQLSYILRKFRPHDPRNSLPNLGQDYAASLLPSTAVVPRDWAITLRSKDKPYQEKDTQKILKLFRLMSQLSIGFRGSTFSNYRSKNSVGTPSTIKLVLSKSVIAHSKGASHQFFQCLNLSLWIVEI